MKSRIEMIEERIKTAEWGIEYHRQKVVECQLEVEALNQMLENQRVG